MPSAIAAIVRESFQQAPLHAVFALVLAGFVSAIAYLHNPRLKALVYSLPVPFTCAYLATRMPINATHLMGVGLIITYNWLVYFAHIRWRWPLGVAIASGVAVYVGGAILFCSLNHTNPLWVVGPIALAWLLIVVAYRQHDEPGHRGATPWWLKLPLVFTLGMAMYSSTAILAGAVSTFPYAGVFTSYEMRRSLRTLAGQFTINAFGYLMAMTFISRLERYPGDLRALLAGWGVFLAWVGMIYWTGWGRPNPAEAFIED
jgi:hypothetical protein